MNCHHIKGWDTTLSRQSFYRLWSLKQDPASQDLQAPPVLLVCLHSLPFIPGPLPLLQEDLQVLLIHMAVCTGLFPRHRPDKTCCTVLDAGENMVFPAVSLLAFVAALMCVFYVGFSLDCSSEDPPSHLGVMYPQTHWRGGENKKLHLEIPIQGMVASSFH